MVRYTDIKNKELNSNLKISRVGMNFTGAVNDDETIIYTEDVATCTGLAIVALDSENIVHRIVSHNYAFYEDFQIKQLELIEDYLKSLSLKDLKVIYCSMKSFKDFNNLTDIEEDILIKLNKLFSFYKEKHPSFNIEFKQSNFLLIDPKGNIDFASKEMIDEYMEENKRRGKK